MSAEMEEVVATPSPEEILNVFKMKMAELQELSQKSAELEGERREHQLVVNTIQNLEPDRKCFRLVGGVLVERTVRDVLPSITNNLEQITRLLETMSKTLEEKQRDVQEYREKYKIQPATPNQMQELQQREMQKRTQAPVQ